MSIIDELALWDWVMEDAHVNYQSVFNKSHPLKMTKIKLFLKLVRILNNPFVPYDGGVRHKIIFQLLKESKGINLHRTDHVCCKWVKHSDSYIIHPSHIPRDIGWMIRTRCKNPMRFVITQMKTRNFKKRLWK